LPHWLKSFVTTGYSHYTTLLPNAFADNGTTPEQVAASLAFVFTLESLALSLGCQRSELAIAVKQAAAVAQDPRKLGLLWTAEWLLGARTIDSIRQFFDELLENAMSVSSMPAYLNGHLLALKFTPLAGPLVVELVSKAFGRLPSDLLMPWLPGLIMMLRQHGEDVLPPLIKEVSRVMPARVAELAAWTPAWEKKAPVPAPQPAAVEPTARTGAESAAHALLSHHRATAEALCRLLGDQPVWAEAAATQPPLPQTAPGDGPPGAAKGVASSTESAAQALVARHPAAAGALAALLGGAPGA
jgi:hypothetical protein